MARGKKKFYYVLVMTNNGPVFVTNVQWSSKTAEWNRLEKPLAMSKDMAEDLQFGLQVNFTMAFAVCLPYELDNQVYRYSEGHFEWKEEKADE